ncbi:DinB family protein [Cytobacillus sp.]|uniref:DinB family protein n=1 Tax=Cytobacillus sp. TaxID=2675269 RepID=UPI0028BF56D8|nr:DinB family protein [Cytobacillus sp.]
MFFLLFPFRNVPRKTLIPYLTNLDEECWFIKSDIYPNNLAWIISHITSSEDFWINEVALKKSCILNVNEYCSPKEILESYIQIRKYTDDILYQLEDSQLNEIVEIPKFSDGWTPPTVPTLNWLFDHVYSHEKHHIGQIAVIASINGFQKPLF